MRALLICPGYRSSVEALSREVPLACLRFASTSLVECWLGHLSVLGVTEVIVLATDRPEQVRKLVSDGARWGLSVTVFPERYELTAEEATRQHPPQNEMPWSDHPNRVVLMDHLPGGAPGSLLASYQDWFCSIRSWMATAGDLLAADVREVQPGVFIGARARVSSRATLVAPCWVGHDSKIGAGAVIGPDAVIENHVSIGPHCVVVKGWVGSETLVGTGLLIRESLTLGDRIIHCPSASESRIADPFLLQPLRSRESRPAASGWMGRFLALLLFLLVSPIAVLGILASKLRGQPALRILTGVREHSALGQATETFLYAELTAFRGFLRKLPQLWNIVTGDFRWIGTPPIAPSQAAQLTTEFERLCLRGPIGLVSPEGRIAPPGDLTIEAIAHASCYAVNPNWRSKRRILTSALAGRRRVKGPINLAGHL